MVSRMLLFPVNWMSRLTTWLRELGPYAALELLLPGGTLVLASLWAFRHRRWFVAQAQRALKSRMATAQCSGGFRRNV
jgi:hypothetical protein